MRVALVASSYLPQPGGLERHVDELARGLTRRGVEVEVLTQEPARHLPPVSEFEGFVVRRFVASVGHAHLAVAPGLWEHLRRTAASFDLVHAHTAHLPLGLAVARAHPRRFVFSPYAPVRRLLHWPNTRMTAALVGYAAQTICTAAVESDLLRARFPSAADRIGVVPPGVDVAAIQAARPLGHPGIVVLSAGRLDRSKRMDRAIAAMPALDRGFRLALVGDGPARHKLLAHAADLRVGSRVEFVGSVPDAELYRWLRTGRVALALAEDGSSGLQVIEALSAGVPVVASDIPVHREAASYAAGAGVKFLSSAGSPLEVADRISDAAELAVRRTVQLPVPTWDEVVERTLALYEVAVGGTTRPAVVGG